MSHSMRIGFDVTAMEVGPRNGTPIYMHRLLTALLDAAPDARFVLVSNTSRALPVSDWVADVLERAGDRAKLVRADLVSAGVPASSWWFDPFVPGIRRVAGALDVFHAGESVWPRRDGTPMLVTVHDVTTALFPEHHTLANRLRHWIKLRWARRSADRVIADSESTRDDLVDRLGFAASRIDVVPLARGDGGVEVTPVPAPELARRFRLDGRYVLTVGTIEPRKNHVRLVRAFEIACRDHPDVLLVIAGGRGWMSESLVRAVEQSPARDRIRLTGFVEPGELRALYDGCAAFAYPSLYEGFGLPVLEAMARGAPVLTSATSSTAEVAGDAALLVDPRDTDSIAAGLDRLLGSESLRRELRERGFERERTFTWQRTARLTLASYRRTIDAAHRRSAR